MIRRLVEVETAEAMADTPVVLIHGPRQAGKSTLVEAVAPGLGLTSVTLDDLPILDFARRDPVGFLESFNGPVAIDEVQRAPNLFLAIKAKVDRERKPGRFLLTGSANILTLPRIADSLAGRMEVIDLLPFSQAEVEGADGKFVDILFSKELPPAMATTNLIERIVRGGYPVAYLRSDSKRRSAWFASYVRTMLERDVRDLSRIDALTQMPRLLNILAARAGATLNLSSMSRDCDIKQTTLGRYIDILRMLFLVHYVPPYLVNIEATHTKAPKEYLVDTGLLCYLSKMTAKRFEDDRSLLGHVLENFVAMELKKLSATGETRPTLMHLRTKRQLEVDFVMQSRDGRIVGVEVKSARSVRSDDVIGLRYLAELAGKKFHRGIVFYEGADIVPLDRNVYAMPISALWSC